jgi:hypothetical protein
MCSLTEPLDLHVADRVLRLGLLRTVHSECPEEARDVLHLSADILEAQQ